ncbi:MAG: transglycosylase SLT domain-containing protein [Spirulina sp.]
MSYLDDETVILNRGCYDETGAQRYNTNANVPDNYVVALQTDLKTLGFSPGSIDGAFGNRTTEALRDFQETARGDRRLRHATEINVSLNYAGDTDGECDRATREEIKAWFDADYRAPLAVPPPSIATEKPKQYRDVTGYAVPFADPTGQYWPIRTRDRKGREIAYQGQTGTIYGSRGRHFTAHRSGNRYHVGIDLWGEAGDLIVACEDGKILNHYHFYDNVDCLIVQCDSGTVINYGEVKPNSWRKFGLETGSQVRAGEPIALVGQMTHSSMCHFETYIEGTRQNKRWYRNKPAPKQLLDPTKYLLDLAAKGKPLPLAPESEPELESQPEADFSQVDWDRLPNFSGLEQFHRAFLGGMRWRLTPEGIEVEGAGIPRTPGVPITTARIWNEYGDIINQRAEYYHIPCALIIATIATESGGDRDAIRKEPGYRSDELTPHKISVGLMQTLISTAREILNDPHVERHWLLEPKNAIEAGTCYIAEQMSKTTYDPPKVACAYNAGGIYRSNDNHWKMRQYGNHCDRFVKWFNDAVAVLSEHEKKPFIPYEVYLR